MRGNSTVGSTGGALVVVSGSEVVGPAPLPPELPSSSTAVVASAAVVVPPGPVELDPPSSSTPPPPGHAANRPSAATIDRRPMGLDDSGRTAAAVLLQRDGGVRYARSMAKPEDGAQRLWRAVHEAFDPIRPVTDPALRVQREARYNPMVELESTWYPPHPVLLQRPRLQPG